MARIRAIKPEFFRHHDLYTAEIETGFPLRVAFAGLWTAADREGRFKWVPEALKLDCLPYDVLDFSLVMDALLTREFIRRYASNGVLYGYIPSWNRHQVINNREKASDLPDPALCTDITDISTRAPRDEHACPTPLCNVQGEGKGKEGKGREQGTTREPRVNHACEIGHCNGDAKQCQESFEEFWRKYPRHAPSRKEALKSWCKVGATPETLAIMFRWIEIAIKSEQWREPSKIPHATTWLNRRYWEGDPPPPPPAPRVQKSIYDEIIQEQDDGQ